MEFLSKLLNFEFCEGESNCSLQCGIWEICKVCVESAESDSFIKDSSAERGGVFLSPGTESDPIIKESNSERGGV